MCLTFVKWTFHLLHLDWWFCSKVCLRLSWRAHTRIMSINAQGDQFGVTETEIIRLQIEQKANTIYFINKFLRLRLIKSMFINCIILNLYLIYTMKSMDQLAENLVCRASLFPWIRNCIVFSWSFLSQPWTWHSICSYLGFEMAENRFCSFFLFSRSNIWHCFVLSKQDNDTFWLKLKSNSWTTGI